MDLKLAWDPEHGAPARLLSWRAPYQGPGADTLRLDVTGREDARVRFIEDVSSCTLESLTRLPGAGEAWLSRIQGGDILVRGLLPFAGNPVAGAVPLIQDGTGVSARFEEPLGVARVRPGVLHPGETDPLVVVAEPRQHVIRSVTAGREAGTPWGLPGVPGHRDGWADEALFHGPTFLACREQVAVPIQGIVYGATQVTPDFVVSDSGNHAIREVKGDGTVATLAGAPLGGPGYRDHADPAQARFDDPQGIAVDLAGAVLVADQGNRVLRRIAPDGAVTTLAGRAGHPGTDDGLGEDARFFQMKGLAIHPQTGVLFLADGHAIRAITPAGRVVTVLGSVTGAGFRDLNLPGEDPRTPCLRDPWGVAVSGLKLFIADRDNHAVREYCLRTGTLRTLAGDPQRPEISWGLLRDGLEAFPREGYGTLLAPRGITGQLRMDAKALLWVATGPCLAKLNWTPLAGPRIHLGPPEPVAVGDPYPVPFILFGERGHSDGSAGRDFEYEAECLDPDGTPAGALVRGEGRFGDTQEFQGRPFTASGTGRIRVRCLTLDGLSTAGSVTVQIR
jgi:hypothetical protein